jgi:hypothetical protein
MKPRITTNTTNPQDVVFIWTDERNGEWKNDVVGELFAEYPGNPSVSLFDILDHCFEHFIGGWFDYIDQRV